MFVLVGDSGVLSIRQEGEQWLPGTEPKGQFCRVRVLEVDARAGRTGVQPISHTLRSG